MVSHVPGHLDVVAHASSVSVHPSMVFKVIERFLTAPAIRTFYPWILPTIPNRTTHVKKLVLHEFYQIFFKKFLGATIGL